MNKKKREKKKRHGTPSAACLDGIGTTGPERQKSISRSTLYDEYKRATTSFKEGLAVLFPSLGTKVHDLVVAVDALCGCGENSLQLFFGHYDLQFVFDKESHYYLERMMLTQGMNI